MGSEAGSEVEFEGVRLSPLKVGGLLKHVDLLKAVSLLRSRGLLQIGVLLKSADPFQAEIFLKFYHP